MYAVCASHEAVFQEKMETVCVANLGVVAVVFGRPSLAIGAQQI